MRRRYCTNLFAFGICFLCCTHARQLEASPLFPGVAASRSANGRFLVIETLHFKDPDATQGLITSITLKIIELNPGVTAGYGLETQSDVYSETVAPERSVTVPGSDGALMIPLVSDDGESIAAVQEMAAEPTMSVLTLYRKRSDGGTVVHRFTLEDLWTEKELYPQGRANTQFGDFGGNPRWFAGDSLRFSPDSKELLYVTRWHDRISIKTENGVISRENKR
jgi:hypothetical protein